MEIKEIRDLLVARFVSAEEDVAELKLDVADIVSELPEDVEAKKIKALIALAKAEAKGKYKELKAGSSVMLDLIDELESTIGE